MSSGSTRTGSSPRSRCGLKKRRSIGRQSWTKGRRKVSKLNENCRVRRDLALLCQFDHVHRRSAATFPAGLAATISPSQRRPWRYPASTGSARRSSREPRSPWHFGPGVSCPRAVWGDDALLRRWRKHTKSSIGLGPKQTASYLLRSIYRASR